MLSAVMAVALAGSQKFVATRDVWISNDGKEVNFSMGGTQVLKLKCNQEWSYIDFDLKPLQGRNVTRAWLCLHDATDPREIKRLGLKKVNLRSGMRTLGISTVGTPWEEGSQSQSYRPPVDGEGATFNQAGKDRPWTFPGSRALEAIFSHGNSVYCVSEMKHTSKGWYRAELDPKLVAAVAGGVSHGFCVNEMGGMGGGSDNPNNFVHSRESEKYAPYLLVEFDESKKRRSPGPKVLSVEPAPGRAGFDTGALLVKLRPRKGTIGLKVYVDGEKVPQWRVPYVRGEAVELVVDGLVPEKEVELKVVGVDERGRELTARVFQGAASKALPPPPDWPESAWKPRGAEPVVRDGLLMVYALPELARVARDGSGMDGLDMAPVRRANAVWDGATETVRLVSARGEAASFLLALERLGKTVGGITLALDGLRGFGHSIPGDCVRLWRVWYVEGVPAYAVPLADGFELPPPEDAVDEHTTSLFLVDINVPDGAPRGPYRGELRVSADGVEEFALKVRLRVKDARLPRFPTFSPELNCYGGPGGAGSEYFFAAHRLAHYFRCAITRVSYSQGAGGPKGDIRLKAEKEDGFYGVASWDDFDENWGPLFDGSAFSGNPRDGVPIAAVYLPFFENWPLPFADHYSYDGPKKGKYAVIYHRLTSKPVKEAFDEEYGKAFSEVARDFAVHALVKGWTDTSFQFYLNNKPGMSGRFNGRKNATWWTLDEPRGPQDFFALRFWGRLFKEGVEPVEGVRFHVRGDISRFQYQFDILDDAQDLMYAGGRIFSWPRVARSLRERGITLYAYGSCPPRKKPLWSSALWCLKAHSIGGVGVLPWQSLWGPEAMEKDVDGRGKGQALVVNGGGHTGGRPAADLRIAALREGAELTEILTLLAKKRGWTVAQTRAFVEREISLGSRFKQAFEDEAAALEFAPVDADAFVRLKEAALDLIETR